jgi:hypothetical protein
VLQEAFWERVRQSKFREDQEVVRMAQTMAEYVREQARTEGAVWGQGEGIRIALLAQLEEKFGSLPPRVRQSIEQASADDVLLWVRRATNAKSLLDLGIPAAPDA